MNEIEVFKFRGDELQVVRSGEEPFVVVKRVCEALGLAEQRQVTKLRKNPAATTTIMVAVAEDGKAREMFCVSLRSLPLWLATIHPSKVSPEIREKLVAYQREAADVLADHFLGPRRVLASSADDIDERIARAVAKAFVECQRQTSGVVGPARAKMLITGPLCVIAKTFEDSTLWRSKRQALDNELRGAVGFFGSGRCWANLPEYRLGDVQVKLDELRKRAQAHARAEAPKKQLPMFSNGAPS